MSIYNPITPTYLYVKQHSITGMKYFGKTTKNPIKYMGSGTYWKKHISKHGKEYVKTLWVSELYSDESIIEDAINFSYYHNIVESKNWANQIPENGLDGAPTGHIGHKFTEQQIKLLSEISLKRWSNESYKIKMSETYKKSWTTERKEQQSKRLTGKSRPDHSKKMKGRPGSQKLKGVPKPQGFGEKISALSKGKSKSEQHKINLSISKKGKTQKTRKMNIVYDHLGNIFDNPRRMQKFYSLGDDFYCKLDLPIRYSSVYEKLGIPYTEENRKKTKRELGFRFQEEPI